MATTINVTNTINYISPILALKAFFIKKCFDAGLTAFSPPSAIPYVEITRSLTTSKPGFTKNRILSWENKFLVKSDVYIVIVRIDEGSEISHTLFKIRNKNGATAKDEEIAEEIMLPDNTYIYPNSIIYESFSNIYSYNILGFSDWVDASTLPKDSRDALDLAIMCGYKIPNVIPYEDNVYGYIFVNEGILPTPDRIAYRCSNRIVGMEILYRTFGASTKRVIKQSVAKAKVNESEESDDE